MAEHTRSRPFSLSGADLDQVRAAFQAAGFDEASVAQALGVKSVASLKDVPPELAWQRTSADTPLHVLVRLFVIGGPAELQSARRALAPASIERLVEGGLLQPRGGAMWSTVKMVPVDGLIIAFDRTWEGDKEEAADHVMGPSDGGRSLANITLRLAGADCLDLGTGCGFLALLAARHGGRVVASDVNPRSRAFVELNARLNGIPGVEAVTGDLFAPVAGRKFDLVFSNPPYVISPDNRLVYMSGGMEGDAFCRRIVAEVPAFLREGGHFQMICNWIEEEGEDWASRLRTWFEGTGCDAWVLRSSTTDPRTYALTWMNIGRHDPAGDERRLEEWLSYYREQGAHSIGAGIVTMKKRPAARGPAWFRAFDGPPRVLGPSGDAVRERMEALDFLQTVTDDEALMASVFLASPKARLTQECEPTPAGWAQVSAHVHIQQGLAYVEEVDTYVAELITACDGHRTLRAAIDRTVAATGGEPGSAPAETADIVRQLVDEGFLLPVRAGAPGAEG